MPVVFQLASRLFRLATATTVAVLACSVAGYADEKPVDSCKKRGPYYYALPGTTDCVFFRTDLKAARWERSGRDVIDVEARRDARGPQLFYALAPLGSDRPLGTWLFEVKPQLSITT